MRKVITGIFSKILDTPQNKNIITQNFNSSLASSSPPLPPYTPVVIPEKAKIYPLKAFGEVEVQHHKVFQKLHETVEIIRSLNNEITADSDNWRQHIRCISSFCDAYVQLVATSLMVDPNLFAATIKLLVQSETGGPSKVTTIGRSTPVGDRPQYGWPKDMHAVNENTVFASLTGQDDGNRRWKQFRCFHSPNLIAPNARFQCTRKDWSDWYHCTLVLPLNTRVSESGSVYTSYQPFGFLTIDSQQEHAFGPLPNIFEYAGNPALYRSKLTNYNLFHTCGIIADSLTNVLIKIKLPPTSR